MPPDIKDSFKVGTKCVAVADSDLRGDITLGSGTILQPRCTVLAMSGPIVFGSNNIIEENVVIVNRLKQPMVIGDNNLFEVGCRIESPSIGSHNTFGIRSRVSPHVAVGSHCVVGAGCIVLPNPVSPALFPTPPPEIPYSAVGDAATEVPDDVSMASVPPSSAADPTPPPADSATSLASPPQPSQPDPVLPQPLDSLVDYTHVFGLENRRRVASREGTGQAKALFVKHWEYLRETLPRYHKLKLF
ncbi:hypothetical protein JCM21900_006288 [Sporobolomyces salmonicolor]